MGMLSCVIGSDQWTCRIKKIDGEPVLIVTMGKENDIPEAFKQINLADLFEIDGPTIDQQFIDGPIKRKE
tara:strand:+ start:240 stop:449 length:210 start_codon:yes stop_codon:yes gene_type:complete